MGVLGTGVTLTTLTGNIFEANTASSSLSSATNDGEGGNSDSDNNSQSNSDRGPALCHAYCASGLCTMHKSQSDDDQ